MAEEFARVHVSAVVAAFNRVFLASTHTELVGNAEEPYYLPAGGDEPAKIFFRADYLRSALHEVAHWCVAGKTRRKLADYGYWYTPDGRSLEQQAAFFVVEAQPQAIERCFCDALGLPFSPSVDNLAVPVPDALYSEFVARLDAAYSALNRDGLPSRAARFVGALRELQRAIAN